MIEISTMTSRLEATVISSVPSAVAAPSLVLTLVTMPENSALMPARASCSNSLVLIAASSLRFVFACSCVFISSDRIEACAESRTLSRLASSASF